MDVDVPTSARSGACCKSFRARRAWANGASALTAWRQVALSADVIVEPVDPAGIDAEWTQTPDADQAQVLLFLHGGGYVSG